MKKLLLLLTLTLSSFFVFSQKTDIPEFPQYYIVNGDTLGIIISLEQAQKIDNDYDMLDLLRNYKVAVDKLDSAYIFVIDNMKQQVAVLNLKISQLEGIIKLKDSQIDNLKEQIDKYRRDSELANAQLKAKDEIIDNYKKEKKSAFLKTFALVIGVGVLFLLK
jgi:TolA-binding protein